MPSIDDVSAVKDRALKGLLDSQPIYDSKDCEEAILALAAIAADAIRGKGKPPQESIAYVSEGRL
jgi:hypothetical protein